MQQERLTGVRFLNKPVGLFTCTPKRKKSADTGYPIDASTANIRSTSDAKRHSLDLADPAATYSPVP